LEENAEYVDDELSALDESMLAEVLGENIEKSEREFDEVASLEELEENPQETIEENKIVDTISAEKPEPTIEEKTLGSVLNINWEELKKAKAKVTITIDFGD